MVLKLYVYHNYLRVLKTDCRTLSLVSDSVGLEVGLGTCISNRCR